MSLITAVARLLTDAAERRRTAPLAVILRIVISSIKTRLFVETEASSYGVACEPTWQTLTRIIVAETRS